MDREAIETRVDELRAAHPEREEFIGAIKEFGETLEPDEREMLGVVLLSRKPESGGFEILENRVQEGGWLRRTMRKVEPRDRRPPR